jgi:hypothetical protein
MTPIRNEVHEIIMSVPDGMTAHEIHKLVYAKFAGTDTGRRFLYSPVRTASGLQAVVVRGDLSAADIPIGQARLLTYPESGAMLRFSLRANPTVKSSITRKREQISLDPAKDAMKLRWLDRRGRANGFEILETGVKSEPMLIDNGTRKIQGSPVRRHRAGRDLRLRTAHVPGGRHRQGRTDRIAASEQPRPQPTTT